MNYALVKVCLPERNARKILRLRFFLQHSDMKEELRVEATEVLVSAFANEPVPSRNFVALVVPLCTQSRPRAGSSGSFPCAYSLEQILTLLQVVVAACEKFPGKFDVAAKMIKEVSVFADQ